MLILIDPNIGFENQYREMLRDWKTAGEEPQPWVLQEDDSNFPRMVQKFKNLSKGIGVPTGFVPSSTFWAYEEDSDKIVGAVNIRHSLNELLLKAWGNIGYGVSPSERKKGYATAMLNCALQECRKMKMNKVLLGCYKENIASAKTIVKNGARLENEIFDENSGKIIQRYWISLRSEAD